MKKAYIIYHEATAENHVVLLDPDRAAAVCDQMNADLPDLDHDSGNAFYIDVMKLEGAP